MSCGSCTPTPSSPPKRYHNWRRRFTEDGTVRMVVFMQYLRLLYFAGVPPEAIAACYARGPLPGRRPVHHRRSPSEEHYHGVPVD